MFYKTEDIYFTLFNGLYGSSHGHVSTGSFTLQLQGDDLISDSGCYSYVNKAEWLQPKEVIRIIQCLLRIDDAEFWY